jgi:branched-subunit amino acid aminotransferase/4-amino-4-deoxychorismate lyase
MATEAQERGCGEVIYRASDGSVCEGARSNVFWRSGNQIFTPALDTGCLPGIARSLLLSWLGEASSPWRPQEICASLETMLQADEIFFSNCTLGPRSVLALRGEGSAAPWTSQGESPCCTWLQKCWRQETEHAATR